jgi:hypothetical protein
MKDKRLQVLLAVIDIVGTLSETLIGSYVT